MQERGEIHQVDQDYTETVLPGLRLDLACGERKADGFLGVDEVQLPGVDFVVNLDAYVWPWKDDSVIEIRCSHYIEHTRDLKMFMEEAWRVLKSGGLLTFIAPYYSSIRAWQDYTHVRPISEMTFYYFSQPWLKESKLTHYGVQCDFDVGTMKFVYHGEWETRGKEALEWARQHYINVVSDIIVELKAVKPLRI